MRGLEGSATRISLSWWDPDATKVVTAGGLRVAPAWSTSKVLVALSVYAQGHQDEQADNLRRALRNSDNEAAEAMWQTLAPTDAARAKVLTRRLREAGDTSTTVPSTALAPPNSIYGQTSWTTASQVGLLLRLPCLKGGPAIIDHLGQAAQPWGLGRRENAIYKSGWGPRPDGGVTSRQFGWFANGAGLRVPVSLIVQTDSEDRARQVLTEVTAGL